MDRLWHLVTKKTAEISKNEAGLNLFNDVELYFKTEEKKIKVSFIHFSLSYETFLN